MLATLSDSAQRNPSDNLWDEYLDPAIGYPGIFAAPQETALPTMSFYAALPNGDYTLVAALYHSGDYRYYYGFDPGRPRARFFDATFGPTADFKEYLLETVTVTGGLFEIYTDGADLLGGPADYFGWSRLKLVPLPANDPTPNPTPTATATPPPTQTATASPTGTATVAPSPTETATATATPETTETATGTATPTETATGTPELTETATGTPTPSETATGTPTPAETATATHTPTETLTVTPAGTGTPTSTGTPTVTPSVTPTPSPSLTGSATATATPGGTASSTPTATPTGTPAGTSTGTPTATATPTGTSSPTATATESAPPTPTRAIVTATPSPTVPPTPTVVVRPVVEWLWVLPDMQPEAMGIQDADAGDVHQHDDDMLKRPSNPPSAHGMAQIAPNLADQPDTRRIEYWFAATTPNGTDGIGQTSFKVYRPDGSVQYVLPAVKMACDSLGAFDASGTPLEAAVHTGQMPVAEATRLLDLCNRNEIAIYWTVSTVSILDPFGEYAIEATIADMKGNAATMTAWFDVLPMVGVKVDFSSVDFGQVIPNSSTKIEGDNVFNPPNDPKPSVKNIGNTAAGIGLQFGPLVGQTKGASLQRFDSQLDEEQLSDVVADSPAQFQRSLSPQQVGKLDFTVYAGAAPADSYAGTLSLWAIPAGPDGPAVNRGPASPVPVPTPTPSRTPTATATGMAGTRTPAPTGTATPYATPVPTATGTRTPATGTPTAATPTEAAASATPSLAATAHAATNTPTVVPTETRATTRIPSPTAKPVLTETPAARPTADPTETRVTPSPAATKNP